MANANYPDNILLPSVEEISVFHIPPLTHFDLIIGGSPCQGFSFAGKQLNFSDPRSKLFFEFERILKLLKPSYFLLENVVMKKDYQDAISDRLGVEPIMINSNLVSAQTRKRLYWTNIPSVSQPKDMSITWGDIREYQYSAKWRKN